MSLSLHYAIVPVEPIVLGGLSGIDELVLLALNDGDPYDQTTKASLAREGVVLGKNDPAAKYLRGALAAMPMRPEFIPRDPTSPLDGWHEMHRALSEFLAELDERGSLLIGAS